MRGKSLVVHTNQPQAGVEGTNDMATLAHLAAISFTSELAASFGVTTHAPLELVVSNGARGVQAASEISRGSLLLTVPHASCISVVRGTDDDKRLASALLDAVREDARWGMYYKKGFLPAEPTNAAMLWSEVEISELQLPFAIERAQELNERFQASLEDLPPEIEREDWEWAYSMVYSRSFVVSESDADGDDVTDVRLLAPFLDLLNHAPESPREYAAKYAEWAADGYDDEPPSPWRFTQDGNDLMVALHSDRDTAAGEEVLLPYGVESSDELLATSGFIPQPNSAEYVPLFADLVEMAGLAQLKCGHTDEIARRRLQMLADLDAVDAPLAARPGESPAAAAGHLLACATLLCLDDTEDERELFREDYVDAVGHYTLVPSQPLDTASARTFCANVALDILQSLPTTLADDEATWSAVRQATSEADGGSRIRLPEGVSKAAYLAALEYRMEAKRILHRFAADCTSRPGIID